MRQPNIQYTVFDPMGNGYVNLNASGNSEWELFALSTVTNNPAVAEFQVPNIPEGLWEVRVMGGDIENLNSLVLPFDLLGVNEEGVPNEPDQPRAVPTLNEWGLIAIAVIGLFVSIFYLTLRRYSHSNG